VPRPQLDELSFCGTVAVLQANSTPSNAIDFIGLVSPSDLSRVSQIANVAKH